MESTRMQDHQCMKLRKYDGDGVNEWIFCVDTALGTWPRSWQRRFEAPTSRQGGTVLLHDVDTGNLFCHRMLNEHAFHFDEMRTRFRWHSNVPAAVTNFFTGFCWRLPADRSICVECSVGAL